MGILSGIFMVRDKPENRTAGRPIYTKQTDLFTRNRLLVSDFLLTVIHGTIRTNPRTFAIL